MAFEPGGRADKLGNRHEGRWVAKQLLRLLMEEVNTVTVEAIGDDEKGVDLWVVLKNGTKQAQQCKARNASKEYWTMGDLKTRDILNNLNSHLSRNDTVEFMLVSGVPFTNLHDICFSARNSNSSEEFYHHQIKGIGENRLNIFEHFCYGLSLNPQNQADRHRAYSYLKRIRIEVYPDNDNTWSDMLTIVSILMSGKPETVISVLLNYIESNDKLGIPIYADEIRSYLETQGFYSRNLAHDQQISPVIERLKQDFDESFRPRLINGSTISREETEKCFNTLQQNGLVILHGRAGSGKSGVIFELTQKFENLGMLYLPIRLDRRVPEKTPEHFGDSMGLPDSPVRCLVALAGERASCLILDQLDAIRWTAMHSTHALDVCKDLIRQVLAFRRLGKKVSVVLSCRTFDLQHDTEIRNWLDKASESQVWSKIEVQLLSEDFIHRTTGTEYDTFTKRQKDVLRNPQNLAMWLEIKGYGDIKPIKSASELLKQFWDFKTLQLEMNCSISIKDINNVIDAIIDYGEKRGTISAPVRIPKRISPTVTAALESYGIIQVQHDTVSFCHQSYLDFFIASRLVSQVFEGGSVLGWLGTKESQSLFRREQLRQALSMMSDEEPDVFLGVLKSILPAEQIRFHLKHLALEVFGQLEIDNDLLTDYCIDLLGDAYWRPHLIEPVFYGNAYWVSVLAKQGIVQAWLHSEKQGEVDIALRLLGSVTNKIGDAVADILSSFIYVVDKGWQSKMLDVLSWEVDNESDSIFELRLQLVRLGFISPMLDWRRICKNSPQRALKLVEAILSTWSIDDEESPHKGSKIDDGLYNHDIEALIEIAEKYATDIWELFMPHVIRLTSINVSEYDFRIKRWCSDIHRSREKIGCVVIDLLIAAGKRLAAEMPEKLMEYIQKTETCESRFVEKILSKVYINLPERFANNGVLWLLENLNRLSLGDEDVEHAWMPAFQLIEALSPHCSLDVFKDLEDALTTYISHEDKSMAKSYRGQTKHGVYFDFWGRVQYILLPALSPARRNESTNKLIAVLVRKYENYSKESLYGTHHSKGGGIGSTLGPNLKRISNKAWLKIISNKKVPIDGNYRSWRQVDAENVLESSIWQFASSLSVAARWYPERFGRLGLEFPADTHPRYVSAILDAMMLSKPDKAFPPDVISSWEAASIKTVLAVLDKFRNHDEAYLALNFCRLIKNRASENWPDYVIDKVVDIALNHKDFDIELKDEATANEILNKTINSVRGVATEALAKLLWNHPCLFARYKSSVDALVLEANPVVAVAVIEVLLPVCNFDRNKAVEWFCQVTKNDARVPASHYAVEFFNYNVQKYYEQLRPIVQLMLMSNYPDVVRHSAALVMAYNLFYGLFAEELELCIKGSVHQKRGVIKNASRFIAERNYAPRCREVLQQLINDKDDDVLGEISGVFRKDILAVPENMPFLMEYIKSKAFYKGVGTFMWYLKEFKDALIPFAEVILATGSELVSEQNQSGVDYNQWSGRVVYDLSPLLLRLYEQAQSLRPGIAFRCLDLWDILFEHQIGHTRSLTREIEY